MRMYGSFKEATMWKKTWGLVMLMVLIQFINAATVSDVQVRRRSADGLVDIDYTLAGDTTGLAVDIAVTDRSMGRTYRPMTFTAFPAVRPTGAHRATWNPLADGISVVSPALSATVSLYRPSGGANNGLYLVVDLSDGMNAVSYPVSYLDSVPQGGWSDEYKTTKLVLRRIEAGSFIMGSPNGGPQIFYFDRELGWVTDDTPHHVTISRPFYMGVFKVTSQQLGSVAPEADVETKRHDWEKFIARLRAKTGLDGFNFPTEAQWEYACRAGTTSKYNDGSDTEADFLKLGGPNAWGLCDMHDGEWEFCLDMYVGLASVPVTDPAYVDWGWFYVVRGGSSCFWVGGRPSSTFRFAPFTYDDDYYYDWVPQNGGLRLCCSAGQQ